jgi:hypothetical protein
MTFQNIHLGKLLKAFEMPENQLRTEIRSDIRGQLKSRTGSGGGDFYTPFWSDAKEHVAGVSDLRETTAARIEANPRSKGRLYPLLQEGFLRWWEDHRRSSNEDIILAEDRVVGLLDQEPAGGEVKIQNLMALDIGLFDQWNVYGYFNKDAALGHRVAQLGLWALQTGLPDVAQSTLRILDVRQGREFNFENVVLDGSEGEEFEYRYRIILQEWARLREEY